MTAPSIKHYTQLALYKTYAELKSEAARTYVSFLWWVVEPVLLMLVFYVVFGKLLNRFTEDFVPFLLVGLVIWRWFESSVSKGGSSIISNRGLINQIYVPKLVFPVVAILVNAFKFLVVFLLLLLFLQWYGKTASGVYWALPLLLATQFSLNVACAFLLAGAMPFLPDLRMLVTNGMRVLFFVSGIFFSTQRIPEEYREYLSLNPMFTLIENYRATLIDGRLPDLGSLASIAAISLVAALAGAVLIMRFDRAYPRSML